MEHFQTLCVTEDGHYIFGFFMGIAKYTKTFEFVNKFETRGWVQTIIPHHNSLIIS
jgi:hypothetical protein